MDSGVIGNNAIKMRGLFSKEIYAKRRKIRVQSIPFKLSCLGTTDLVG
jgi:hypothetical protein